MNLPKGYVKNLVRKAEFELLNELLDLLLLAFIQHYP